MEANLPDKRTQRIGKWVMLHWFIVGALSVFTVLLRNDLSRDVILLLIGDLFATVVISLIVQLTKDDVQ